MAVAPEHDNACQDDRWSSPDDVGKAGANASATKQSRLRKACDSCSLRKVKCDATQPCQACQALDIPCTFNRPSRRRGPPNRLAESIKREYNRAHPTSPKPSSSPPYSQADHPNVSETDATLSLESIGPIDIVRMLVDDYFTYIHPLQPFPHEPTYRRAFEDRADLHDRSLVALTAAMIGSLVASYPRRPQKRLKSLGLQDLFPRSVDFVKHCQRIICEARGFGHLERSDLNSYDAATSYCLLTMCASTFNWQQADLYLGECFTIVRCLLARKPNDERALSAEGLKEAGIHGGYSNSGYSNDLIEREMLRRVFWTVFVTIRSAKTFGAAIGDLSLKAPTASTKYPPLPAEVDDGCIHPTHIDPQPSNTLSQMVGFNTNVRIYLTFDPLVALEDAYSISQAFSADMQKKVLRNCVAQVKNCFDGLPEELLIWPTLSSRSPSTVGSMKKESEQDHDGFDPYNMDRCAKAVAAAEIQKANIHASYLSSRSYFVEKYWSLMSALGNGVEIDIQRERESIAEDLLNVLSSIRPVHMEPNSVSFNMKIRQIASTLLPSAAGGQGFLADSGRSAFYLRSFLTILMDLEKCSQMPNENRGNNDRKMSNTDESDDEDSEEEELRQWANLREQQREFVKSGASIAGI